MNLYGNKITDNGAAKLAGKKQVRELSLSLLAITDRGLAHLKSLENLHSLQLLFSEGFAGPKVTDAGLGNLKLLTKLRSLNLIGAKISDGGLQRLGVYDQAAGVRQADHGELLLELGAEL